MTDSGLVDQILSLDKENMLPILEKSGIKFPEEKRLEGLRGNPTVIVALDEQSIAGYLDYRRSWNDADYIYIGSVQVKKSYRNTGLLLELLDKFRESVATEDFRGFETSVQKANQLAVKMYRKIGFVLQSNPNNEASWVAKAGRELLLDSPIVPLINKWRAKQKRHMQPGRC